MMHKWPAAKSEDHHRGRLVWNELRIGTIPIATKLVSRVFADKSSPHTCECRPLWARTGSSRLCVNQCKPFSQRPHLA